MDATIGVEFGC